MFVARIRHIHTLSIFLRELFINVQSLTGIRSLVMSRQNVILLIELSGSNRYINLANLTGRK